MYLEAMKYLGHLMQLGMDSSSLLYLASSVLTLFLLLTSIFRKSSKKKTVAPLPPSPPGLPFIGNLHQLGSPQHRSLYSLAKKHGPIMLLRLGRQPPTLVISSAEMAREIVKTHDRNFASRPPMKATRLLFNDALDLGFAPYSEYWRQLRKLTTVHLLSAKKVQSYRGLRQEETAFMVEKIRRASCSGRPVDLSEVLNTYTADVITRIVSGRNFRENGRDVLFSKLTAANNAAIILFFFEDFFPSLSWADELLGTSARLRRIAKAWDAALGEVMNEHTGRLGDDGGDDAGEKNFVDVLLSLLNKPDGMDVALSMDEVKALMMDMFGAGTETTYVTLVWAMAELVRKPEVVKKLQDEVRAVAKYDAETTLMMIKDEQDLERMVYLRAVLKEVLRLHPAAPLLLPHEAMEDCQIQGFHIPKKTRVVINAWAVGRDPKHWKDPEEFKPERFSNSSVDFKGNDPELIPFGAGRRICPGLQLAVSNMELALANLVCCFDWEMPGGLPAADLDMREATGLTIARKSPLCLVAKQWSPQCT